MQVAPQDQFEVFTQGSIRIPINDSEPESDLTWVVQGDYSQRHPEPHEVALLVEVAESSLETDRGSKLGIYAEAGIVDYWIVNLIDHQIEVHRNPVGRDYLQKQVYRGDTPISPLVLPTATLQASRLFG